MVKKKKQGKKGKEKKKKKADNEEGEEGEEEDEEGEEDEEEEDEEEEEEEEEESEESEESEEEDEYLVKEREYKIKREPDEMNPKTIHKKLNLPDHVTSSKVLVANFMAEDCTYMLKKLISVADYLGDSLRILVLPLPQDATSLDTYYAKLLCKLLYLREGIDLSIFFVRFEDK